MSVKNLQLTADEEVQQQITHLCERNSRPHVVLALKCQEQKGKRLMLSLTTFGGTSFMLESSDDSEGPSLPYDSILRSACAVSGPSWEKPLQNDMPAKHCLVGLFGWRVAGISQSPRHLESASNGGSSSSRPRVRCREPTFTVRSPSWCEAKARDFTLSGPCFRQGG